MECFVKFFIIVDSIHPHYLKKLFNALEKEYTRKPTVNVRGESQPVFLEILTPDCGRFCTFLTVLTLLKSASTYL